MPALKGPAPQTKGRSDAADHSDAPDSSSAVTRPFAADGVENENLGRAYVARQIRSGIPK